MAAVRQLVPAVSDLVVAAPEPREAPSDAEAKFVLVEGLPILIGLGLLGARVRFGQPRQAGSL